MITLRQIQFALAVAEHLHFKNAAEACFVSQSTLSLGISEFEKSLGVSIFERSNKQVTVTSAGRNLLARAEKIYIDAQFLMESARASQQPLTTMMNVGFIPTIAPYFLPIILPLIRERYPDFTMNIHEDLSERLLQLVQNGKLDAAIIALPYQTDGFDVLEFGTENFFVVAQKSTHLSLGKTVKPQELLEMPLMLLSDGHCMKDQIIDLCQFSQSVDKGNLREASLSTLIQMSINGMGVTLVPEMAIASIQHHKNICIVPLGIPEPHRRIAIVSRPHYARKNELDMLKELFTSVMLKI